MVLMNKAGLNLPGLFYIGAELGEHIEGDLCGLLRGGVRL